MLKLNIDDNIDNNDAYINSNTTLVKVKFKSASQIGKSDINSNTTLVKVKFKSASQIGKSDINSNTTLVKVK